MKHKLLYTLVLFASLQTFAQTNTYEYDANNRLTKVTYGNGVTVAYSYDALGNRTSKKVAVTATQYTITTNVSPANAGTVTGGGTYYKDSSIELKAVANSGYKFSKWSDGNTSNPRTITVTGNKTYTAEFVKSSSDTEDTDISQYANVLYIERSEAFAGNSVTLSVNMKNSVQAEGFGFDLYLPSGITVAKDADGFPEAYLSTKRTTARKTNTFESTTRSDGSLRVFAASTNGSVISGNDGEVCTVKINIDSSVEAGEYPLILKEIAISDIDAQSHDVDMVKTTLVVKQSSTGIDSVENGQWLMDDNWYTMDGIKLKNKPTKKGIYIRNGKKIVVK
ncbi:MAG: RHS repeat protein [Prevotella sp.]|nr:RHS repeat protein [Prevotella sp.]